MRSWVPWSLVVVLTAVVAASAVVGATAHRGEPTYRDLVSPFYSPSLSLRVTTSTTTLPSLPPQGGFRGVENFCAVAPLTGTIHYDGTSGSLTGVLTVSVGGLPPDDEVFVNWSDDYVRAPVIAGFATDSEGDAVQSSVVVGRLGEVRGVEIVVSAASVPNPVLGRLEPC